MSMKSLVKFLSYRRLLMNDSENIKIPVILNGSVVLNSSILYKAFVNYLKNKRMNLEVQPINKDPSFVAVNLQKTSE